jgi:hypothetical protein
MPCLHYSAKLPVTIHWRRCDGRAERKRGARGASEGRRGAGIVWWPAHGLPSDGFPIPARLWNS